MAAGAKAVALEARELGSRRAGQRVRCGGRPCRDGAERRLGWYYYCNMLTYMCSKSICLYPRNSATTLVIHGQTCIVYYKSIESQ